ncbi:ANKRD17, partial [Symbiodinium sp. CCMP2456]
VTNRFYFSFLNDAQWRVIGRTIRRPANRERFGQFVGERLYQSILRGEELKSDVPDDSPGAPPQDSFAPIGQWPKLSALTRGGDASSLTAGARQLLQYLLERGYCESFEVGEASQTAGIIKFTTFVRGPVNLDATASLMRSNENFAPRYDQRILQAYFAECGFRAIFQDGLAENATSVGSSVAKGTRASWTLTRET